MVVLGGFCNVGSYYKTIQDGIAFTEDDVVVGLGGATDAEAPDEVESGR